MASSTTTTTRLWPKTSRVRCAGLFGWPRACEFFGQLDRRIRGKRIMFGLPRSVNASNS